MCRMTVAVLCLNGKTDSLVNISNSYNRKNWHHKLVLNKIVVKVCFTDYAANFVTNRNADFFEKNAGISTNTVTVNDFVNNACFGVCFFNKNNPCKLVCLLAADKVRTVCLHSID